MKIFCKYPTVNISKNNFGLVMCFAKNLIWTTLKAIFSIFRFEIPDLSQMFSLNKTYINGKLIYSAFRLCMNLNIKKWTLMTDFVVQGHIWFHAMYIHVFIFVYATIKCLLSLSTGWGCLQLLLVILHMLCPHIRITDPFLWAVEPKKERK